MKNQCLCDWYFKQLLMVFHIKVTTHIQACWNDELQSV